MSTHRRTTLAALAALALVATATPASARPIDLDGQDSFVPAGNPVPASLYSRPDKSTLSTSATAGGDFLAPAAPPPAARAQIVRAQAPQTGFDWGDAGIGAAGGIGIAMLAAGGGLLAVRMRRDHLDPATR
jgi:hypothetical protein